MCQFIECGLIKEVDQQVFIGGCCVIFIVIEICNFYVIGVWFGCYDVIIILFDFSSKVLVEEYYLLLECIQQMLEYVLFNVIVQFIDSYQCKLCELIVILVILLGFVDLDSGKIYYMLYIQVENWGLVEVLEECFKVICFVGYDICSLVLVEYYFGVSQDCEDFILVCVYCGIGVGIIFNGCIFIGCNGNVGEIGYIQVELLGECCYCGNFGCLEIIVVNVVIE